jgi:SAM-dependent methyltransferase
MDQDFLNESINYYRDKIRQFGGTAQGMDWKNVDTQNLRFEIISRYIDFVTNPSVLDVGCGNGEFYNYVQLHGKKIEYNGIDTVPEMVEMTRTRFGEDKAVIQDLLSYQPAKNYDFVIASGTFNAKLSVSEKEWEKYFYSNLKKMFELCDKAVVFNCMTSFVDYTYDRLYYPSLSDLTSFIVKELSRKFIVDHSYPLYEQTVVIYR